MMDMFRDVPKDEDTRIKFQELLEVEGMQILHQKWTFEGVAGESFILHYSVTKRFSESEILDRLKKHYDLREHTKTQAENGYFFINFGFRA